MWSWPSFNASLTSQIEEQLIAKVTLAGMSKIGYREVYVLDLQPAIGGVERLYLDAQTYLPVRLNNREQSAASRSRWRFISTIGVRLTGQIPVLAQPEQLRL